MMLPFYRLWITRGEHSLWNTELLSGPGANYNITTQKKVKCFDRKHTAQIAKLDSFLRINNHSLAVNVLE